MTTQTPTKQTEVERVLTWRAEVLERAGYGVHAAHLAMNPNVDLRQAEQLLKNGCEVEIAVAILT